jgi:hypothetical protein
VFVLKEVESNIIKEEFENTRGKHSTIEDGFKCTVT